MFKLRQSFLNSFIQESQEFICKSCGEIYTPNYNLSVQFWDFCSYCIENELYKDVI
jgi:hypothetical protein